MIIRLVGSLLEGMQSLSSGPTNSFHSSCAGLKRFEALGLEALEEVEGVSCLDFEDEAMVLF